MRGILFMITEYRQSYLPLEYPKYHETYQAAIKSIWHCSEVNMSSDIADWNTVLTEMDKKVVGGILRGFTLAEMCVADYWSDVVVPNFPKPEIVSMARTFAAQEAVHAEAYNHLAATLGINDHEAFLASEIARKKIGILIDNKADLLTSLVLFSAGVEGVSLFSSFAILLSFSNRNLLKGVGQILGWSVTDEDRHSTGGISLFKDLVQEQPGLLNLKAIKEGMELIVQTELDFITDVFSNTSLPNLSLEQITHFILYRAQLKINELELGKYTDNMAELPWFVYNEKLANEVAEWFDVLTMGERRTDFFAQKPADYATIVSQIFNMEDLFN